MTKKDFLIQEAARYIARSQGQNLTEIFQFGKQKPAPKPAPKPDNHNWPHEGSGEKHNGHKYFNPSTIHPDLYRDHVGAARVISPSAHEQKSGSKGYVFHSGQNSDHPTSAAFRDHVAGRLKELGIKVNEGEFSHSSDSAPKRRNPFSSKRGTPNHRVYVEIPHASDNEQNTVGVHPTTGQLHKVDRQNEPSKAYRAERVPPRGLMT